MFFVKLLILSLVQGAAELLPVSSSAHVIIAEKLMGLDPTSPQMTLLLVMLHTGTMFAVVIYFWNSWKNIFDSKGKFINFAKLVALATVATGIVGLALKELIEKIVMRNTPHAAVELLFGNLTLISISLAAVGLLIIYGGTRENSTGNEKELGLKETSWIGLVQGLCLPFRGFSRSGATISAGLISGVAKTTAEEFSFALAVVLTPPVVVREVLRLLKANSISHQHLNLPALFYPSIVGMIFSFASGMLALKWLSSWLEGGRWKIFGYYCIFASVLILLFMRF